MRSEEFKSRVMFENEADISCRSDRLEVFLWSCHLSSPLRQTFSFLCRGLRILREEASTIKEGIFTIQKAAAEKPPERKSHTCQEVTNSDLEPQRKKKQTTHTLFYLQPNSLRSFQINRNNPRVTVKLYAHEFYAQKKKKLSRKKI